MMIASLFAAGFFAAGLLTVRIYETASTPAQRNRAAPWGCLAAVCGLSSIAAIAVSLI